MIPEMRFPFRRPPTVQKTHFSLTAFVLWGLVLPTHSDEPAGPAPAAPLAGRAGSVSPTLTLQLDGVCESEGAMDHVMAGTDDDGVAFIAGANGRQQVPVELEDSNDTLHCAFCSRGASL